ncbi:MAG: hypothetical protein QOJ11_2107 [Frankiales bacterium]|nr:hypothetical protein [Frankiales bacterium]
MLDSSSTEDFRRFVAARQRALLRTAWFLTGDWGAAEDVVQLALVRAWPHWSRVAATEGGEAYVRRIIVNKPIDWRCRQSSVEVPTPTLPETANRADGPDVDLKRMLVAAVRALPPRQRAVVVLRYFDDLTEAQTAAAMGCSVGTVKSQASKALASLRREPLLADLELEESAP